jgi:hypothetical protein
MASQPLKLVSGERSRGVRLILSKDGNKAVFVFRPGIGMDQTLNEPEDGDVTPNPKSNRQH